MLGSMAVMGAAFTSCSKEVAFDSEGLANQAAEQLKAEYRTNFEKKYGAIAPNQTWDFSTMKPVSGLPSTASAARTRGEVSVNQIGTAGDMNVEKSVITWMHDEMHAGTNNSKKGSPFYLKTQEQTFTIVPFYQGQAGYYWELWMNIGGEDVHVWSKNTALQYKTADGNWHNLTGEVPENAVEVKAPTYTYKATPDQNLYFYLKVWTGGSKSGNPSFIASSLDQMMLALEGAKKPANVPEGNEVTIIGCEDNLNSNTDHDYEDLVFLIYGKPTPPIIPSDEIEVTETKRYMMEDLGATDDFDFNDVVVDVQNVYTQKIHMKPTANGGWEEDYRDDPVYKGQRAIVRAAGGTLDFTIEIGTNTITRWKKVPTYSATNMLNTGWDNTPIYYSGKESVLARFDIEGNDWNPATNNIRVIVEDHGASGTVQTITFPKAGEAPMMIAVDKDVEWMKERQSVPGPKDPNPWWY